MSEMVVWEGVSMSSHVWAFCHFCKRQGDYVVVELYGNHAADIGVDKDPSGVLSGTLRVREMPEPSREEALLQMANMWQEIDYNAA